MIQSFSEHQLIALKDEKWMERQQIAGRSICFCFDSARSMIENRIGLSVGALKSDLSLIMRTFGCQPVFLNDKKTHSIFIRVNNHIVDDFYLFKEHDLIQICIAAQYEDAIAKATITHIKNKPKSQKHLDMLDTCKKSINNAISHIEIGKRVGCIGAGIHHVIKNTTFRLVPSFGYGIDIDNIFADPVILNKSQSNIGVRMSEGMTFTICSVISFYSGISDECVCCFEKTVFIKKDSVQVITNFDGAN